MKRCPNCQRVFGEDLLFCLDDGSPLEFLASSDPTVVISHGPESMPVTGSETIRPGKSSILLFGLILLLSVAAVGFGVAYFMTIRQSDEPMTVSTVPSPQQNQNERIANDVSRQPPNTPETTRPELQKQSSAVGPLPPSTNARTVDPPTNIRDSPNGKIQCVLDKVTDIPILRVPAIAGSNGLWYRTTACGRSGLVHSSQISFE